MIKKTQRVKLENQSISLSKKSNQQSYSMKSSNKDDSESKKYQEEQEESDILESKYSSTSSISDGSSTAKKTTQQKSSFLGGDEEFALLKQLKSVNCQLLISGYKPVNILYFFCKTCDPDEKEPICQECAYKCHGTKGHDISEPKKANNICTCGVSCHAVNEKQGNENLKYDSVCKFQEWSEISGLNIIYEKKEFKKRKSIIVERNNSKMKTSFLNTKKRDFSTKNVIIKNEFSSNTTNLKSNFLSSKFLLDDKKRQPSLHLKKKKCNKRKRYRKFYRSWCKCFCRE